MQMLGEKLLDLTGVTSVPRRFKMIGRLQNHSGCVSPSFEVNVVRKAIFRPVEIVLLRRVEL